MGYVPSHHSPIYVGKFADLRCNDSDHLNAEGPRFDHFRSVLEASLFLQVVVVMEFIERNRNDNEKGRTFDLNTVPNLKTLGKSVFEGGW